MVRRIVRSIVVQPRSGVNVVEVREQEGRPEVT